MRIVLGESVAPRRASYLVLKHLRPLIKRQDMQQFQRADHDSATEALRQIRSDDAWTALRGN